MILNPIEFSDCQNDLEKYQIFIVVRTFYITALWSIVCFYHLDNIVVFVYISRRSLKLLCYILYKKLGYLLAIYLYLQHK